MFKALGHWLKQIFGSSQHDQPRVASLPQAESDSQMAEQFDSIDAASHLVPYDENLLERARTQWQFGDWQSLANLDRDTLQHHPDRAKLALLAAAGLLQTGQAAQARQYTRLAHDWGASKKLISQILVAGVHNSIGRAAAIGNQAQRALQHFERAISIGTPGSNVKSVTQARLQHQLSQLPLGLDGAKRLAAVMTNQPAAVTAAQTFSNDVLAVLAELHETLNPRFYLEIGVANGSTLALAKCKAIGIDPIPQERIPLGPNVHHITASSEEFFANQADIWLRSQPLDFALIAGLPLVDHVLRSLIALEPYAQRSTLIAVPGIFPNTAESATRHRTETAWLGDLWKLPALLRQYRSDLQLLQLDIEPAGLLLIAKLDPNNKALMVQRSEYAAQIQNANPPPQAILSRAGGARLDDPSYTAFMQTIHTLRS
jgi:hypothetical protein